MHQMLYATHSLKFTFVLSSIPIHQYWDGQDDFTSFIGDYTEEC